MRFSGEDRWRATACGVSFLLGLDAVGSVAAQRILLDKQEQRRRAQQLDRKETERRDAPFESALPTKIVRLDAPLPGEGRCFPLRSLRSKGRTLRGGLPGLNWDLFAGQRIRAPCGLEPRNSAAGFQLSYQY